MTAVAERGKHREPRDASDRFAYAFTRFLLYLISPRTAHRVVGYFEEEAVFSYTEYLAGVDAGVHENVPAPEVAIRYWGLAPDARLREVILAVREDEARHRDVNHELADEPA